ncbi:MAG: PD-(D/E)XK nuclease family protein [Bacilli bacterium]
MNSEILKCLDRGAIIVGPGSLRRYFLDYKNRNPFLNFKYFTKSGLETELFGEYKETAIKKVMQKLNVSFEISNTILSYFSKGMVINEYNKKYESIFNDLLDFGLYYKDVYAKELFKEKEIIFIGYTNDDVEIKNIINYIGNKNVKFFSFDDLEFKNDIKEVNYFLTIDEEVKFVLNEIAFEIDHGAEPKDFLIFTNISEYKFYFELFSKEYNIPLNFDDPKSLYDTNSGKILISNLSGNIKDFLTKNVKLFENDLDNYNKILYLADFYDFDNINKNDIPSILKSVNVRETKYVNGVTVTSVPNFDPTKKIFATSLNKDFFPTILKNNDYFDDAIKKKVFLTDSVNRSQYYRNMGIAFLHANSIKSLSFSASSKEDGVSYLLKELDYKITSFSNSRDEQYAQNLGPFYYKEYDTLYRKFNVNRSDYSRYLNQKNSICEYNNEYKHIEKELNIEPHYSYSSLSNYLSCPFKYYVSNVLRLNEVERNFYARLGTFAHKLLEHVYDKDLNFESLYNETINLEDFSDFTPRERIFLDGYKDDLYLIMNRIRKQNEAYPFIKTYHEQKLVTTIKQNIIVGGKEEEKTITINGFSDRINEYKEGYVIIDYKTGHSFGVPTKDKPLVEKQYQLPIYSYLVSTNSEFNKKPIIAAFIQPLSIKGSHDVNSLDNGQYKTIELCGYIENDMEFIKKYDPSLKLSNSSSYIMNLKINNDGGFSKSSKVYTRKEIDNFSSSALNKILETNEAVFDRKFEINPSNVVSSSNDFSCKFCDFDDICYVNLEKLKILRNIDTEDTDDAE